MSVAIGTLLPEIRVELPGIPVPILNAALYRVVRQFFWESEVWKYTYDNGLDWTLNQLAVESPAAGTDIPTKTIVKRVDTIKYDSGGDAWNREVPFKTRDELDRDTPAWYTVTGSTPRAWTHGNDGAALITPQVTATVTTALLIRSIVAPVFTSVDDTLPDLFYYEFEETIKSGILGVLMKQPGKDWTNIASSNKYLAAFGAGVKKAKSRAEADFGQPKGTMSYGGL